MPFDTPLVGAAFLDNPTTIAVLALGLGQGAELVKSSLTPSSRFGFEKTVLASRIHQDVEAVSLSSCSSTPTGIPLLASMTKRGDVAILDASGTVLEHLFPNGIENYQVCRL
jgi:hypothetical protein